jgi:hypothetical protein
VEHHNKVARFLEAQGFREEALEIATDPDYKFELAVQVLLCGCLLLDRNLVAGQNRSHLTTFFSATKTRPGIQNRAGRRVGP